MSNAYRSSKGASAVLPTGDAVEANVLAGKTFSNAQGTGKTGTMVNRGAVSQTIQPGGSYTIPEGYHNGSGTVTAAQASGYDIVELIQCHIGSGTYVEKNITAQVGDYLALAYSDSSATLNNTNISETTEITITGAIKTYKVDQAMSSSTVRLIGGGNSGGAILHIRSAS